MYCDIFGRFFCSGGFLFGGFRQLILSIAKLYSTRAGRKPRKAPPKP